MNLGIFLGLQVTERVALVADCGRISFQTVRWLMREKNLAKRASPAINATQCSLLGFFISIPFHSSNYQLFQ